MILLTCLLSNSWAQSDSVEQRQPIKIDFLANYYNQDGQHSAVTGGEGTEKLQDYATTIKIFIPLKKNKSLQLNGDISYFTSASTDKIDPFTISSASASDLHLEVNAKYEKENQHSTGNWKYNIALGGATEAHFASVNGGFGFSKQILKSQGEWQMNAHYIMDVWGPYYRLSKLFPSDYFGPDDLVGDKRHTLQISNSYRQIVNQRLQFKVQAEVLQQFGLISTVYNRVFFSDKLGVDIERLPNYKLRIPLSFYANYYANDAFILRGRYRFYWDNFGLKAHSFRLELPIKLHRFLRIAPFYRYHIQYGNRYFAGKGQHLSTEAFYTSDFDMSDLQSHYFGGSIRYQIFRKRQKKQASRTSVNNVSLRAAYYRRNDGFHSWLIGGGLTFAILRKQRK